MNNNFTTINNIQLLCQEVIYKPEDIHYNADHTYIARDGPFCLKLLNLDKPLILQLNQIYTIELGSLLYIEKDDDTWNDCIISKYEYLHNMIGIKIRIEGRLIGYNMTNLTFVIINNKMM